MKSAKEIAIAYIEQSMLELFPDGYKNVTVDCSPLIECIKEAQRDALLHAAEIAEMNTLSVNITVPANSSINIGNAQIGQAVASDIRKAAEELDK